MKKLIVLSAFLVGCMEGTEDKFDRFMSELDCPVILIGKTEPAVHVSAVTVRDGKGRVRTFSQSYGLPAAISHSRKIGDTLKPCK